MLEVEVVHNFMLDSDFAVHRIVPEDDDVTIMEEDTSIRVFCVRVIQGICYFPGDSLEGVTGWVHFGTLGSLEIPPIIFDVRCKRAYVGGCKWKGWDTPSQN